MNRLARKHRSTKVPNVKLRPAPTGTNKRRDRDRAEAEAEAEDLAHYRRLREAGRTGKRVCSSNLGGNDDSGDDDEDNEEDNDDDKSPLLGCVICMTGLGEEKTKLTEYAIMLGAQVQGNLTEDATHLIANEPGSEKYRCALKLGLPILRAEWLRELRARWTEAVHYDFDGLMEEHRLDTFEGLCVALAGITEPSERTDLRKRLKSGSAKTPTTFALDGSFTHLICGDIKDSKTMEVVKKYRQRAERFLRRGEELPAEGELNSTEMRAATNLKIVWKEWVEDCLEVQGSIDEHLYAIEEPRLTLAQRKELKEVMLHERRQREILNGERMKAAERLHEAKDDKRDRGERMEAKVDNSNEVQRVTKKPKMDFNSFVQQISKGEAIESKGSAKLNLTRSSDDNTSIPSVSMTRSFTEPSVQAIQNGEGVRRPTIGSSALLSTLIDGGKGLSESVGLNDDADYEAVLEDESDSGLHYNFREKSLSSLSFRLDLHDEDRNQAARKALQARGIKSILDAKDPNYAHFHILPLGKVDSAQNDDSDTSHLGTPVTHLFIERCLFESRVLGLNESFALQPSIIEFPLPGAEDVCVGITGFAAEDDIDRKQLESALRAAGIESSSTLKRGLHTHLLFGRDAEKSESSRIKIQRAKEWGIHIVDLDFIDRIYKEGIIEPTISRVDRLNKFLGKIKNGRVSMGGATIGETQTGLEKNSVNLINTDSRPLEVNRHVSNAPLSVSRPWQRSASGSQALLDGEESRGVSFRGGISQYQNPDSLEAGSLAIKTSAEEVMALLSNRHRGDVACNVVSTSSTRKRGRLPPSRLKEGRFGFANFHRGDGNLNEAPTAEELLAMRQQQEDCLLMNGPLQTTTMTMQTQMNPFSTQEDESMRITYDDPSSRRERRKIGELIATSVKHRKAKQDDDGEEERSRSSSTETEEETVDLRTSSASPCKVRSSRAATFVPSIQARRQPGTGKRFT